MNVHFIAIGGAVMHNLALALHKLGHRVTGSDDEIYDPAQHRLREAGILPAAQGWFPERITPELDTIILGMHAKKDNPELLRAQELGLKVLSFPEFIHEHSKMKQRVVIAGSHGKTTITAMVMHVLKTLGRKFDYLVGAELDGFDLTVRLSEDAPVIIMEGDEYLASPLDRRSKFLLYKPHNVLISGIAWDHINVFPTEEEYNRQFALLIQSLPKAGTLVFNEEDRVLNQLVEQFSREEEQYIFPYRTPEYRIRDNRFEVRIAGERMGVEVIGAHNMANIAGAFYLCKQMAVEAPDFLRAISTFKGAARRLEKVYEDAGNVVYKDFAHSPSKVVATVGAIRELFGKANIVACLELHTFSSLNKAFLKQYRRTLKTLKKKIIFVNEHTLAQKNYPPISRAELVEAFDDPEIELATNLDDLKAKLRGSRSGSRNVFLMMSSGNFGNLDLQEIPRI
jgi:UDP-N-acetylmuramate: L-alanyl-gamma-D-glutamyl-meso-diaminopimelate ligase